jgi:L-lactate dehydrogenase complex protein LldE
MRVAVFTTCLVDQLFPRVGVATVETLRRLGLEVDYDGAQTCCGQPAFNAGYRAEARRLAEHCVDVFDAGADVVVAPSGSCTAMVRTYFRELFREPGDAVWRDRLERVRGRVRELSEFLVRDLGLEDVGARFEGRVTYHDACHLLRELGLEEEPRRLIRAVRGVDFVEMAGADACCGFGGTFSVTYPEISSAMARDKVARIEATGAEYVIAADASCLMQIGGALGRAGSPVKTMHLAELLARG